MQGSMLFRDAATGATIQLRAQDIRGFMRLPGEQHVTVFVAGGEVKADCTDEEFRAAMDTWEQHMIRSGVASKIRA